MILEYWVLPQHGCRTLHLAVGPVELHEVYVGPLLELVQVPLDGIPSLKCVNRTTQLPEGVYTLLVLIQNPEGYHLSLVSIWTGSH